MPITRGRSGAGPQDGIFAEGQDVVGVDGIAKHIGQSTGISYLAFRPHGAARLDVKFAVGVRPLAVFDAPAEAISRETDADGATSHLGGRLGEGRPSE
ncbi:hypothetical protein Q2T94_19425 [Paeniglutamicibacter sulfureus]|uniref:hypothetical protein n=1 Tax=Paeniglutamicibacter sulfureus TaxID=43666 RepID=UPI0026670657|nr:hypothetical protein [Paeniglutamicibacter sulfureus]MDO2936469.1 hypothetical protein [Paeniglutamicibacter sulfureus]